jgi:hypothetical protein
MFYGPRFRYRRYRRHGSPRLGVLIAAGAGVLIAAGSGGHAAVQTITHHGHAATMATAGMPANEVLANQMAAQLYGWDSQQQRCLDVLWTHESAGTWSPTVTNPSSGAYGIPQALPASKMAAAGPDWQTSPATQIRWGLGYIHDRYSTPCAAESFEFSHTPNWY